MQIKPVRNIKLKGFTLVEFLIAMLLSSVVFILIFFTLHGFQSKFKLYNKTRNISQLQLKLELRLAIDILKVKSIFSNNNYELVMKLDTSEIKYIFNEDMITRTVGTKADTFEIENKGLKCYKYVVNNLDSTLVKSIYFQTNDENREQTFRFTKTYTSDDIIQYLTSDINANKFYIQ